MYELLLIIIGAIAIIYIAVSISQRQMKTQLDTLRQQYQHDIAMLKDDYNNKITLLEQKLQKYMDK